MIRVKKPNRKRQAFVFITYSLILLLGIAVAFLVYRMVGLSDEVSAMQQSQLEQQSQLSEQESQNKSLQTENDQLKEQQDSLKQENSQQKAEIDSLKQQVAAKKASGTGKKVAYLTFDDGPNANTAGILDVLKQNGVQASFFVVKNAGFPDAYKRIVAEGHTLALHTATHNFAAVHQNEAAYYADLQNISDFVEGLTGVKTTLLRFPGGSSNTLSNKYCPGIMAVLKPSVEGKGYHYFDWNVDSGDASGKGYSDAQLVSNVLSQAKNKQSIMVLMHDHGCGRHSAAAVAEIIAGLRAMGFTFEKIDETTPGFHHG